MTKIRYVYFSALHFSGAFITQVVNWLELYSLNGIDFDLYRTTSIKNLNSSTNKVDSHKSKQAYQKYRGKLYFAPTRFVIGYIYNFIVLFLLILKYSWRSNKVVIQTRDAELSKVYHVLKRIFNQRLYIIFDSRAAGAEELKYSKRNELYVSTIIKYNRTLANEKQMVSIADKVFCVSDVLINYHKSLNKDVDPDKFFLYPCLANSNHFYYSQQDRISLRTKINADDKIVIVYSGGLRMPWHLAETMFKLMSELISRNDNLFFLVLSKDDDVANSLAQMYRLSEKNWTVLSLNNNEIFKYLSAADIALLLRDDVPMNNVASPTKFAEYLMCGLPVLISENVGDFSLFVEKHEVGLVINNDISAAALSKYSEFIINSTEVFRNRRIEIEYIGQSNFSKDLNLKNILEIYKAI
jgi:glycosyltransferase involved in cell wall biosynthesis